MAMRITGGALKGRVLRNKVLSGVRPTSARVREAIFSMVGQDLEGLRLLDAFGGSGLMGLEAWSRGDAVVICEKRAFVARAIRDAAKELDASVSVSVGDGRKLAEKLGPFDAIIADPPYAFEPAPTLERLIPHATQWVLFEADARSTVPEQVQGWVAERRKVFGQTQVVIYVPAD